MRVPEWVPIVSPLIPSRMLSCVVACVGSSVACTLVAGIVTIGFALYVSLPTFPAPKPLPSHESVYQFNEGTVGAAWEVTKERILQEDERFRHIDSKANTLLGLLGIAIAVIGSIGGLLLNQGPLSSASRGKRTVGVALLMTIVLFFILSFSQALLASRVVYDPESGGHYSIPSDAMIGTAVVGQDVPHYRMRLIAEGWEVITKNSYSNVRKALRLASAQTLALWGAAFVCVLVGFLGTVSLSAPQLRVEE